MKIKLLGVCLLVAGLIVFLVTFFAGEYLVPTNLNENLLYVGVIVAGTALYLYAFAWGTKLTFGGPGPWPFLR